MSKALDEFDAPINIGINCCADYLLSSVGLEAAMMYLIVQASASPEHPSVCQFDRLSHSVWRSTREWFAENN